MTFFKSKDPIRFTKVFSLALVIVISGFLFVVLALSSWQKFRHPGQKVVLARVITMQIDTAIRAYATEYGTPPAGDNVAVVAALMGQNPRQVTFFEIPSHFLNTRGELIDPWDSPYHIQIRGAEVRVWSCGKDRIDNDGAQGSDDVVGKPFHQKPP